MSPREHFPVIEHGRKHTLAASIVGRRLLDFGTEVVRPAGYVFTEATRVSVSRGVDIAQQSLEPVILPIQGPGFTPDYDGLMDRRLYYVDHHFRGEESTKGIKVSSGVVSMRNEGDLGRAELTVATVKGAQKFSLRQAGSRKELQSAQPSMLVDKAAASILRAVLTQQGEIHPDQLATYRTANALCLALSAITPATKVEREKTFNTTHEGTFTFSTLKIHEEEMRYAKKKPVLNSQEITCRGIVTYPEHPGIVGTVGASLVAGYGSPLAQAALQAWIELPEGQSLTIPERNRILNTTIRPFQTLDGFFGLFNRQLAAA